MHRGARVLIIASIIAWFGCATSVTTISSGEETNECGAFATKNTGTISAPSAGDEFGRFAEGCRRIQSGKADAEYVKSLRGAANYYVRQEGAGAVDSEARARARDAQLIALCSAGDEEACTEMGQSLPPGAATTKTRSTPPSARRKTTR